MTSGKQEKFCVDSCRPVLTAQHKGAVGRFARLDRRDLLRQGKTCSSAKLKIYAIIPLFSMNSAAENYNVPSQSP